MTVYFVRCTYQNLGMVAFTWHRSIRSVSFNSRMKFPLPMKNVGSFHREKDNWKPTIKKSKSSLVKYFMYVTMCPCPPRKIASTSEMNNSATWKIFKFLYAVRFLQMIWLTEINNYKCNTSMRGSRTLCE